MMDIVDLAQQLELDRRADALAARHAAAPPPAATGICRDCGDPIDAARLKAHPFAQRCIDCQTAAERTAR